LASSALEQLGFFRNTKRQRVPAPLHLIVFAPKIGTQTAMLPI
jgi:hypothetical protein